MTKANLTQIAFILDRSGSMSSMRREAVNGFNKFLEAQLSLPGTAKMSFIMFNDEVEYLTHQVPLLEMVPLRDNMFQPQGNTALDDAMGLTIDRMGKELAQTPEEHRPEKVIIAVLTDGEENASRIYSTQKIAQMIEHQTRKYGWEFIFLGASPRTREQAQERNFKVEDVHQFMASPEGMSVAMSAVCEEVSKKRRYKH